jgi:hypothetical protein
MSGIKVSDIKKFRKQWVALTKNNEIVGNGNTIDKAIKKAKAKGIENPTLLYLSPTLETCVV